MSSCPTCGAELVPGAAFCEACGAEISGAAPAAPTGPPAGAEAPIELSRPVAPTLPVDPPAPPRTCTACGGTVAPDGYCETCGAKAVSPRDHFVEQPAPWVAGVCDRGVTHHRNEDALALAADAAPGGRAVLVVCDGVSTSTDSDVASLAGARAARDVLAASRPAGLGTPDSRVAAVQRAIAGSARAANDAVVAHSEPARTPHDQGDESTASATFVVAVLEGSLLVTGCIGDSRAYWLPDEGEPLLLTTDDSVAQVRIAAGVPRDEAENGPQAHAITRWLGRDAPDVVPSATATTLDAAGWVLVCSDGLWNYASEPTRLAELVAGFGTGPDDPLPLADELVRWACDQGGRDNITVALARHTGA